MATSLALFEQKGYYGVSVSDIANACSIARGSLYTHFESKQDLVNSLYRHWKNKVLEYSLVNLETHEGRARHRQLWRNLFAFARDHPTALSFLESQQHASYLSSESKEVSAKVDNFAMENYRKILRQPIQKQHSLAVMLSIAYGGYNQIAKMSLLEQMPLSTDVVDMVEEMMWRILQMQEAKSIEHDAPAAALSDARKPRSDDSS